MNKAGQMSAKSRLLTLAGERFPGGRRGWEVTGQGLLSSGLAD